MLWLLMFVCLCVCVSSQIIQVRIINVAEYEKQETFSVILEDPKWLKRGISGMSPYMPSCIEYAAMVTSGPNNNNNQLNIIYIYHS